VVLDGCCFYAPDVPDTNCPHFIVVIASNAKTGKAVIVPISSIKFVEGGSFRYKDKPCKYYDSACILDEADIIADDGRQVLSKPSFMRYEWAREAPTREIITNKLAKVYNYKCMVSPEVLQKMREGFRTTKEVPKNVKASIDYVP
jgi:hypothetical protein